METAKEKLERCFRSIRAKTDFKPVTAIVLGSGLGDYADSMDVKQVIDYKDIEGFPVSTAPGHKGRFVMGYVGKVPVIAMQGRFHYYEGYDMKDVVLPIRIMHMLGAKRLILTNASGGIRRDLKPGDIMMITDQISSLVPSPLRGINFDKLGPRFPDMSEIYDKSFREKARKCALKLGIELKEGIYIQTQGPNYESPAEIRAYEKNGSRRSRNVDHCRGYSSQPYGNEDIGTFMYFKSCGRHIRKSSYRGGGHSGRKESGIFTWQTCNSDNKRRMIER